MPRLTKKQHAENKTRAARAKLTLAFYRDRWDSDTDDQTVLVDLLADVLHLAAEREGGASEEQIDLNVAVRMANVHASAELNGE